MAEIATLDAALGLIGHGLAVFPMLCFTNREGRQVKCPPKGHHGYKDGTLDESLAREWWSGGSWQLGVACGSASGGLLVIDIDGPSHNADGEASLARFEAENGKLPDTVTALTGGGGRHLYYRVQGKLKKRTGGDSPLHGVDFLAEGMGAIAPPSRHPNGKPYRWAEGLSPDEHEIVELAPDSPIIKLLAPVSKGPSGNASLPDVIMEPGRNDALYRYGCAVRAQGYNDEGVRTALVNANAARCQPPLSAEEVESIVCSVLKREPGSSGGSSGGSSAPTLNAIVRAIGGSGVSMGFDTFECCPVKTGTLPWDESDETREWAESDTLKLRALLEDRADIRGQRRVEDALQIYADDHKFDSLKDMLRSLEWDGRPRAGYLFATYLGAALDEYSFEVERLLLREMVARAFEPGVKADFAPVLVGQGSIGKSTLVNRLAITDALFTDSVPDLSDIKATGEAVMGRWVVELSELSAMRGKDIEAVKAAITRQSDRFRPAYGRKTLDMPRRCVFVGTTNDPSFISDRTGGARRFLPIQCGVERPTQSPFGPELATDARQAVAEMVAQYLSSGGKGFSLMLPAGIEEEAAVHRDEARVDDPRIGQIQRFLDSYTGDRVCCIQLAVEALGINKDEVNRYAQRYGRELAPLLDNDIAGWTRNGRSKKLVCGSYGKQTCWVHGM